MKETATSGPQFFILRYGGAAFSFPVCVDPFARVSVASFPACPASLATSLEAKARRNEGGNESRSSEGNSNNSPAPDRRKRVNSMYGGSGGNLRSFCAMWWTKAISATAVKRIVKTLAATAKVQRIQGCGLPSDAGPPLGTGLSGEAASLRERALSPDAGLQVRIAPQANRQSENAIRPLNAAPRKTMIWSC